MPIPDLDGFTFERIRDRVGKSAGKLEEAEAGAEGRNRFALLLVDGLCLHEETLISAIAACLDDIPVVGGSAGDGDAFQVETWVLFDGEAHATPRCCCCSARRLPCRPFKCNSFEPTSTKLVVTEADIERRIVRELNAEPAAREYARIVGVPESELNAYVFAAHPVIVRVGGDYYARSIQRVNADGSLTFFCAIDEGLVLTAAGRLDTLGVVEQMFRDTEAELGEVSLYLGFDCLHRRLDAEQRQIIRDMEDLYRRHNVVGFNTYGEQYRLDAPQPDFSGVAIGRARRAMSWSEADVIERLTRENAKLKKINAALMSRVERGDGCADQRLRRFSRSRSRSTTLCAAAPRNCRRRCARSSAPTRR